MESTDPRAAEGDFWCCRSCTTLCDCSIIVETCTEVMLSGLLGHPVRLFISTQANLSFTLRSMLSFVAFFITICYHTIYASPWIFPPLAFYGLDILMRMFRVRIKDATLVAVNKQMTIVRAASLLICSLRLIM